MKTEYQTAVYTSLITGAKVNIKVTKHPRYKNSNDMFISDKGITYYERELTFESLLQEGKK